MAAGNPITQAVVNQVIAADAMDQVRNKYYIWLAWYDYYNNAWSQQAQLATAGITVPADIQAIQTFITDIGKLAVTFTGSATPAQTNYLADAIAVQVWQYDANRLKQEFAGVAYQLRQHYYWWRARYRSWATSTTLSSLQALGFSAGDAQSVINVYSDMNTLAGLFNNGAALGSAINMISNCETVLGVQG